MPKEWILNQANMRWGLTKKNKVGAVSDEIRKCAPKFLREWEEHYYKRVYPKEHLENLGRRLYIKITEVCQAEIESIAEQDCIDFIISVKEEKKKVICNPEVIEEIRKEIERLEKE